MLRRFHYIRSKFERQLVCFALFGLALPMLVVAALFFYLKEQLPVDRLFLYLTLALIGIVLCFLSGLLVFFRRIVRTLDGLRVSMRRLEKGDFVPAAETHMVNEVGEVVRNYNLMVNRLGRLVEDMYQRELRRQELEEKVATELAQPHFIFNTLETIAWKANQAGRHDIGKIASRLGKLIRLSISSHQERFISLDLVLRRVELYIELQKLRYKERMDVIFKPYEQDIRSLQTIKLVLLPCIENAINYGLRPHSIPLHISIGITRTDSALIFEISDDGAGMSAERLAELRVHITEDQPLQTRSRGVGLKNIHDRLVLYFGAEYGLSIESEVGVGTRVLIKTPIITKADAPDTPRRAAAMKPGAGV
jgi:two-component system sensor histidine kinase YesM